jgi:phosphoserine phosphatase RsbU/P
MALFRCGVRLTPRGLPLESIENAFHKQTYPWPPGAFDNSHESRGYVLSDVKVEWRATALVEAAGRIIERGRRTPPDGVHALVSDELRRVGARDVAIMLVDLDQEGLVSLEPDHREWQAVEGSLAGRAYLHEQIVESEVEEGLKMRVPLIDGRDRLGVLELTVPTADAEIRDSLWRFSGFIGELLVTKDLYGDAITIARRRREMSLAAEMQWELLPPLTVATEHVSIAGILEPSYEIGGDTFDYAVNGQLAHLALFDAMGHGLPASLTSALAVGSYRHNRRLKRDLPDTYVAINDVIEEQLGPERFATGLLGELDCGSGRFRWMNAGHPLPFLIRNKKVIASLECAASRPLGLGGGVAEVAEHFLEPDDSLLLFTDGVTEAKSTRNGEQFGEGRLADRLERELQTDLSLAEIVRRLARSIAKHRDGPLEDDATMLLVHWKGA